MKKLKEKSSIFISLIIILSCALSLPVLAIEDDRENQPVETEIVEKETDFEDDIEITDKVIETEEKINTTSTDVLDTDKSKEEEGTGKEVIVDDINQFYVQLEKVIEQGGGTLLLDLEAGRHQLPENDIDFKLETTDIKIVFAAKNEVTLISYEMQPHLYLSVLGHLTLNFKNIILDGNNKSCGIEIRNFGNLTVHNATIQNCHSNYSGSGISSIGSLEIIDSTFKSNHGQEGGAAYSPSDINISNCNFIENNAYYGGAVKSNSDITVTDSIFKDNKGGAIYTKDNVYAENCQFENNIEAIRGGAVYAKKGMTIINCNVIGNTSHINGGGLYSLGHLTLSNSLVKENKFEKKHVEGPFWGGGVFARTGIKISDSIIEGNTAELGGAVYGQENITITDSLVSGNKSRIDGGAVYSEKGIIVTDSIFSNNTAGGKGSTLFAKDGDLTISTTPGGVFIAQTTEDYNFFAQKDEKPATIELKGAPAFFYIQSKEGAFEATQPIVNNLTSEKLGSFIEPIEVVFNAPILSYNGNSTIKITDTAAFNLSGIADTAGLGDVKLTLAYSLDNGTEKQKEVSSGKTLDISDLIEKEGTYKFALKQSVTVGEKTFESDLSNTIIIKATSDKEVDKPSSGGGGGGGSSSFNTVKFDTNGGSLIDSVKVAKEGKVSEPKTPTKEGYKFLGWFTDKALTKKYDFSQTVTDGFTLYAGWEKISEKEEQKPIIPTEESTVTTQNKSSKAYVSGFPDGTFAPDRTITRAEGAQMLYSLALQSGTVTIGTNKSFTDVNSEDWYYAAVSALSTQGIINGYEDGTFQPNKAITRGEFLVMVLAFAEHEAGTVPTEFTDVNSSHWAAGWIGKALELGLVSGYPDGTFRPDNSITRAEGVFVINGVKNREGIRQGTTFSDVPAGHWAYEAITAAASN